MAGGCPWVSFLRTCDNVTEHKIVSEEVTPKLIKDWLEQRKVVSQSFYASSGVAFSLKNLTVL